MKSFWVVVKDGEYSVFRIQPAPLLGDDRFFRLDGGYGEAPKFRMTAAEFDSWKAEMQKKGAELTETNLSAS